MLTRANYEGINKSSYCNLTMIIRNAIYRDSNIASEENISSVAKNGYVG